MRIGLDARLYRSSAAGIGRYSQNLIQHLLTNDHANEYVLLMTPEDSREFKSQVLGLKNINQKVTIVETEIGHYSVAEQTKLPSLLKKQNCDFWHFLNFNFPIFYRGKFIVTIHDLTLLFYPGRTKNSIFYKMAYKFIFHQACQKSEKIIAVSKSTEKDIVKVFQTDPQKIKVIYEAADDKTFTEVSPKIINGLRSKFKLDRDPIILYVGQWRPHKNLLGLIRAFEILRTKTKAKLAIVGKIDPAFPEVNLAIDKSPYMSDIIRSGFVSEEDLAGFYKLANVFVFPSFYEGFGLPGLEAMMAGVPVAASNRTSLPEIYGGAASYFNPDDPQEISRKILEIIQNKAFADGLVQKGYCKVKEFSWVKTAEETLSVYRRVKTL